jgi:membrane protein implicated in regulation of membrane protease activity
MNAQTLLAWWNLIFVVPFGIALVYLGLYTLSGLDFGEADADADVDAAHAHADADLDADADVDADADAGVDNHIHADADADADADTDVETHAGAGGAADAAHVPFHVAAMGFLGVGRVPVSLVLMVLLMTWGTTGFLVNQLAFDRLGRGWHVAALSIPAAALASLAFTRMLVRAMDRWVPLNETSARRRHDLLGSVGRALYPISGQFGLVTVRDDRGELYQVPCRVAPDGDPIAKGAAVRLVSYSAKTKSFYVTPSAPDDAP